MISSEVQRTLVKSPPELWAELSDPASLARHLGDLGEIRITRVEPEQLVEWATEDKTGKVQIKPSGWGTRVTLTVEGELPQASDQPLEPAPSPALEPAPSPAETTPPPQAEMTPSPAAETPADPSPAGAPDLFVADPAWPAEDAEELASDPVPELASEPMPEPAAEPTPASAWLAVEEPEPRRGFLAKLFRRRRTPIAQDPEPVEAVGPIEWVESPAVPAEEAPFASEPPVAEETPAAGEAPLAEETPGDLQGTEAAFQAHDTAAEPVLETPEAAEVAPPQSPPEPDVAEEIAEAEVSAVLTSVLDRLGAAHHRPFSRS
jgi:hypothetical protein